MTLNAILDFVVLPNHVRLEFVEQGDPAGIPVVLLHGSTDSWHSFEPVLPLLPPSLHVFALSLRGHGDSGRPSAGYDVADFAADLALFLASQRLESAVIVGHSMGSAVAQRFASDQPARTRGLVLLGSFVNFRDNAGVAEFVNDTASQLIDPVPPETARDFQESTLARPVPPVFLATVVAESLKVPARVWREMFVKLAAIDHRPTIATITAPTLVLWGDRDIFSPRGDQLLLANAIPGAQLVVYEGAGHALHWEEPERFAADLADFVAALPR